MPGCSKQGAKRIAAPAPRPDPGVTEFRDARWITAPEELREAMAGAGQSPLVTRAVQDEASDPRFALLTSGVIGATGTSQAGTQVRITLLPYQDGEDSNHAFYFALIEVNGVGHVESFELMRNEKPGPEESGYVRVNDGEHGVWLRGRPTYVQALSGVIRRAPERFNYQKFAWCFVPTADLALGAVNDACDKMGNFPGCVTWGSGLALAGAAAYCAYVARNG